MYSPHIHLDIARARHSDMLRAAEHARLVASFEAQRPGFLSRLRDRLGRRRAEPQAEPQRAPAAVTV
jgi:hypothetical protein